MRLDLCDKCHPFYTGTQKLVDTGGRVQRFADKFGGADAAQLAAAAAATPTVVTVTAGREAQGEPQRTGDEYCRHPLHADRLLFSFEGTTRTDALPSWVWEVNSWLRQRN
jgi:hypothetical protein